jgi:hypothetical protein
MAKITIGGLFDEFGSANQAIDQLIELGIRRSQISVASEASTYKKPPGARPRSSTFKSVNLREVGRAVASGSIAKEVAPTGDLKKWLVESGMAKGASQKLVTAMRKGHTLVVLQVDEDQAKDALELFSGTHGSGGGITGFVPGGVVVSSGSPMFRKQLREQSREGEPPGPEESGTHGSGTGITGRHRSSGGGVGSAGGAHGPGKGIKD